MKKIIFILLMSLSINSFAQNEISGTVTYYFNEYQGDKVDLGAKVYLIDSSVYTKTENFEYLKNFNRMVTNRNLLSFNTDELVELKNDANYKKLYNEKKKLEKNGKYLKEKYKERYNNILTQIKNHEKKIEEIEKNSIPYITVLKKNKALKKEDWSAYISKASDALINLKFNNDIKTKTVNGVGTYSFKNIANGTYYILIISKNRTSLNSLEIMGKIYVKQVTIKNQNIDISHNFDL